MKIIDRSGRLFGKISVIDLLVVAVVIAMGAGLYVKNNQPHTGTAVTEETITFQIRATGVRDYAANALAVGDSLYDLGYSSGDRALGEITDIQVERDPGTTIASFSDGTVDMVEAEGHVDLLITVEGTGLVTDRKYSINRIYDLGVNASRTYYTRHTQFVGKVAEIF